MLFHIVLLLIIKNYLHVAAAPKRKYEYDVTIQTGPQESAGTFSFVKLRMFNDGGQRALIHINRKVYERGSRKTIKVSVKKDLGHISKIQLAHFTANFTCNNSWYVKEIQLCKHGEPKFLRTFTFPVEKWLRKGKRSTYAIEVDKQEKKECGTTFVQNVTSEIAEPNAWPWQAQIKSLTSNRPHHCSGVLIQRQWVLTAASCLNNDRNTSSYQVTLGHHDLTRNEYTDQEFEVDEMAIHTRHLKNNSLYNIALLKLRQPVIINRKVKIICLPEEDGNIPVVKKLESSCYSTGWEDRPKREGPSSPLKQTGFSKADITKCNDTWHRIYPKEQLPTSNSSFLCMRHQREPYCHDDTGGPLVCTNIWSKYMLYGLDIFEKQNCKHPNKYTLFLNILKHLDWIEGHVFTKYIDPTELLPKFR